MADTDRIESDARAFGAWFADQFQLPKYAKLLICDEPPFSIKGAGSAFGLFCLTRKNQLHRATEVELSQTD